MFTIAKEKAKIADKMPLKVKTNIINLRKLVLTSEPLLSTNFPFFSGIKELGMPKCHQNCYQKALYHYPYTLQIACISP